MAVIDSTFGAQPFNDKATATATNKDVVFAGQPFFVNAGSGGGSSGGGGASAARPQVFVCT
jgi:hypothetical protein